MRVTKGIIAGVNKAKSYQLSVLSDLQTKTSEHSSPWDFGPGIQTLKLSMVLLVYVYSNDDSKISFSEKRSFKKEINSIEAFSTADKEELINMLSTLPLAADVLHYITKNELSNAVVTGSIKLLKKDIKLSKKYIVLLDALQKQYEQSTL